MLNRFEIYGAWLREDPAGFVVYILCFAAAALLSLTLHECAHGYVALRCGDPTAKLRGRLSLNPARHLDPVGTLCMVVLGFGWARPVPVDPRNYRHYRRDEYLVSVAGIAVNLALFLICSVLSVLCCRLMLGPGWFEGALRWNKVTLYTDLSSLIVFGGVTLPRGLMAGMALPWLQYPLRFLLMMTYVNLPLAVFNLLPIPPLDGWRIVNNALRGRLNVRPQTFRVVQVALVLLCFTGLLGQGMGLVVNAIEGAMIRALVGLL